MSTPRELYERAAALDAELTHDRETQRLALGQLIAGAIAAVVPQATQVTFFAHFEDDTWYLNPDFQVTGTSEQDALDAESLDDALRPVCPDEWAGFLERAYAPIGPWTDVHIAIPSGAITLVTSR